MNTEEAAVHQAPAKTKKPLSPRKRAKAQKREARLRARGGTRAGNTFRRGLAMVILMALLWGLFWFFSTSEMAEPLMSTIVPLYGSLVQTISDPMGVDWAGHIIAIGMIVIPHIGILMWFLDET